MQSGLALTRGIFYISRTSSPASDHVIRAERKTLQRRDAAAEGLHTKASVWSQSTASTNSCQIIPDHDSAHGEATGHD